MHGMVGYVAKRAKGQWDGDCVKTVPTLLKNPDNGRVAH